MSKDTSELFEFNKMLFIYVTTILITLFWLLKMVLHKKIILKKTFFDIPILIFLISQIVSMIFSLDRHISIFGNYGRFNGGLLSILSYIILYFAFVSNNLKLENVLRSILISSLLVVLWAIPGKFGHDLTCLLFTGSFNNSCWDNSVLAFRPELRAFSTLGQPNWLGAYLAVTFFVGIYYLIKKNQNTKYLILNTLYLFLNFSMILFTRSRSALMAVFVGIMLFMTYYFIRVRNNFKNVLISLLIITIIPIILFKTGIDRIDKYLTISKINVSRVSPSSRINDQTSTNVTESFDIRKIVWQGAWELGKKYPLFGTGVETFAFSYNFVRPVAHNLTSEWDYVYNKAHNEYLNYLSTTGFIGLGAYLLMIVFVISYGFKHSRKLSTILLIISYIVILITNFFGFSTTTIQLFFYLIPAFIILKDSQQTESEKFEKINAFQWLVVFVLIATTIYLLFSITIYYLADVNYSYGQKYVKVADQQKAALYFEKALKLRQEPVYEDRFSSSLAYLSAIASLQNQKESAKQIKTIANSYNLKTIQAYPKNVFYWKTRAKNMYYFYLVTGNDNELLQGIKAFKTAGNLSPTDPTITYTLALYYSTLFDSTKNKLDRENWAKLSLSEIDKTIILKSNYRAAYLFKGQLLKKYGEIGEAKKVFEYKLKNFDRNDTEVLKELDK